MSGLDEYLRGRYTPATAKAYKREIEAYVLNFAEAETALHRDIAAYVGALRQRYPNPRTLNRILAAIKAYYDFLSHTGARKDHPARSLTLRDKISSDVQLQDLFSPEELEQLLSRGDRYYKLDYRNKALIGLFIYQGLLPAEAAALQVGDINLEEGTIYVRARATSNARELQLKPKQVLLIYQYITEIRPKLLKGRADEAFLLGLTGMPMTAEDLIQHIIRSYRGLFGHRKVNAQTIRQSVIANLLKAGHDLRVVQTFAGHKHAGTTERYKQSGVEALKAAIQRLHPMA